MLFFRSSDNKPHSIRRCEARCSGNSDETTNGKPIQNFEVRNFVDQVDLENQPRSICCDFPGSRIFRGLGRMIEAQEPWRAPVTRMF